MDEALKGWWSVHVEAEVDAASDEIVEDLLDILPEVGGASPALSWSPGEFSVQFSVRAPDAAHAISHGLGVLLMATEKLGIDIHEVPSIEATTHERLARELTEDPERYFGVNEVAEMLGVSKQRVSELRMRSDFPAPVAELAAGPVWRESSLRRFVAEWPRRPGRPGTLLDAIRNLRGHDDLPTEQLTDLQREVLRALASGATMQEIADEMGLTPEAVRSHVRRLLDKLAVLPRSHEPSPRG